MRHLFQLNDRSLTIIAVLVVAAGFFLRFLPFPDTIIYEWEQGRDAWVMKDMIVERHMPLIGPRVAIENFHLGPLYYYVLSVFYALFQLDPVAIGYAAIVAYGVTVGSVYIVTKKMMGTVYALTSLSLYVSSHYFVLMDRVMWNVSFVIALSFWTIYSLYRTWQGSNRWIVAFGVFMGLFTHVHITGIFFIPLMVVTLYLRKRPVSLQHVVLGTVACFIFLIPVALYEFTSGYQNMQAFTSFITQSGEGIVVQTFFVRLVDIFFIPEALVHIQDIRFAAFLVMVCWWIFAFRSPNRTMRYMGIMSGILFFCIVISTVVYGGIIFEYYYFITAPFVLIASGWLIVRAFHSVPPVRIVTAIFLLYWVFISMSDTMSFQYHPTLSERKKEAFDAVKNQNPIPFDEGSVTSYLYDYAIYRGKK